MFTPKRSWWPIFFTFLISLTHHLLMVNFQKKSVLDFVRTSLNNPTSRFQYLLAQDKRSYSCSMGKLTLNHQLYHVNLKLSLEYFTLSCFLLFLYPFSISSCAYYIFNSVHCRYKILLKHAFKNDWKFCRFLLLFNSVNTIFLLTKINLFFHCYFHFDNLYYCSKKNTYRNIDFFFNVTLLRCINNSLPNE